eukprot:m.62873 g.62873  ORF g.62873 m.62873 type:complete len:449 (+) comp35120_c1_seq1:46-1392(+)
MKSPSASDPLPQASHSCQESTETPKSTKRNRVLLVIGAVICGINGGIQLSGSYLIPIAEFSCPSWSKSATVIGQSLSLGLGALTGVLNCRLVKRIGCRASLIVSLVMAAIAFGLCGISVQFCGTAAEVVYVTSFALMGIRANILYFAWIDPLLSWFPRNRHGFAVSTYSAAVAVGSIGYSQFFLFSQRLQREAGLAASTVFFIIGLFVVFTTAIGVIFMVPPKVSATESTTNRRPGVVRKRVLSLRFFLVFVGRFFLMLPGFSLISRQQDFLCAIWKSDNASPIHFLLTLVMVVYAVARSSWVFVSDWVGIKNLWVITGAAQSFSLALIPIFIGYCELWGRYASLVFFCLFMAGFSAPKSNTAAFVTEIWDSQEATIMTGMFAPSLGLAGLLGPVVLEAMFRVLHSFTVFLLFGSGIVLSGLLAIIAVKKIPMEHSIIYNVQDSENLS